MKTIKIILISFLLSVWGHSQAQTNDQRCPVLFSAGGIPPIVNIQNDRNPTNQIILCRIGYSVIYHDRCKGPLAALEYLIPENFGGVNNRAPFRPDPSLAPHIRAELKDYKSSGFDRGHLAPAFDFSRDSASEQQSFYLSNIVPQARNLNRKMWKRLETQTRNFSTMFGGVYVITGAIYNYDHRLPGGVCIPTQLCKVIVSKDLTASIGFLVPNDDAVARDSFYDYVYTIAAIEKIIDIKLFPAVADNVKQSVSDKFVPKRKNITIRNN